MKKSKSKKLVLSIIVVLYILKSLVIIITWLFLGSFPKTVLIIDSIVPLACIFGIIFLSGGVIKKMDRNIKMKNSEKLDKYLKSDRQ